jgi:hypothetical protein
MFKILNLKEDRFGHLGIGKLEFIWDLPAAGRQGIW